MSAVTDRIEKQIILQASPARVWRALSDSTEFGAWFGVILDGPFKVGERLTGKVTTPGCKHMAFFMEIERMDPETLFRYRWNPIESDDELRTTVDFSLKAIGNATQLTIVESGFDKIPVGERDEAFRRNDGGWTQQIVNVENYISNN